MLDQSLTLLREGFAFILHRRLQYKSDVFETRLMLEKTLCMGGPEAARLFYDPGRFRRKGAVPGFVQDTLFGRNAVQTMDGTDHHRRKSLFLELTGPAHAERLQALMTAEWRKAAAGWRAENRTVVLLAAAQDVLCRAVCAWAGVSLPEADAGRRGRDMGAMVDAFGSPLGPRHWRGRAARRRAETWMEGEINRARRIAGATPLHRMALWRAPDGSPLKARMAAIELLNILRPTVAISYYIVFAALALHEHPACRRKILADERYLGFFIQEVRRFYPFAPFLGARARKDFVWRGCPFRKDQLVLLDLYGANHDPALWEEPGKFRPERFAGWNDDGYTLIPQGGGDALTHRCPGEDVTIAALRTIIPLLIELDYDVPPQDLGFSLSRMPTYPRSGFIFTPNPDA
jgi:fatty-acid peroxygenase